MHWQKLLQTALLSLPLMALGCGSQRADTRETYTEPSPAMGAPGAMGPVTVMLGSQVGADGQLASHSDTFRRGEPIISAVEAGTLKAGTAVRLTWKGPQGQVLANDEIVVPPGASMITFKAQDTTAWAPGTYRVETTAGTAAGSKTFTVE